MNAACKVQGSIITHATAQEDSAMKFTVCFSTVAGWIECLLTYCEWSCWQIQHTLWLGLPVSLVDVQWNGCYTEAVRDPLCSWTVQKHSDTDYYLGRKQCFSQTISFKLIFWVNEDTAFKLYPFSLLMLKHTAEESTTYSTCTTPCHMKKVYMNFLSKLSDRKNISSLIKWRTLG